MNGGDYVVLLLLAAAVILAVRQIRAAHRHGGCCGCSGCSGNCGSCGQTCGAEITPAHLKRKCADGKENAENSLTNHVGCATIKPN